MRARARQVAGGEPLLAALVAFAALGYTAWGWLRYADLSTGVDLAIFDQVLWHYSRFETPASTLSGAPAHTGIGNILGDHFHPILALLTPLYWIWADPRTLIAAQAVLLAAAAVPIFLYARRRVGRRPALMFAAAYLVSWTVLSGVAYDFHEVAFAPVLIATAVLAADERRPWLLAAAIVALLLTKEDLGILVAVLGVMFLAQRRVLEGVATVAAGIGGYLVVTKLAIPHFARGAPYPYWSYSAFGPDVPSAAKAMLADPLGTIAALFDERTKLRTDAALFVPVLGLVVASPLLLPVALLVAERMLSSRGAYWGTIYHYSLTVAPLLFMGAADGLGRLVRAPRGRISAAGAVLLLSFAAGAKFSPAGELNNPELYKRTPAEAAAFDALARVPDGVSVATQAHLVSHLSHRGQIRLIRPGVADTDYVLYDPTGPGFPTAEPAVVAQVVAEKRPRYRLVAGSAGVELLARR